MLKCKHCQGTEFGLTVVETKVSGFRAIGGEVVEQIGEPEVKTETNISYCFGCNKPITEEDTYENETCPVCGKEVEALVNGRCADCDEQVNALANMSKEELIMMMLQGNMPKIEAKPKAAAKKKEEKPVAKKEVKTTAKKKEDKPVEKVEVATSDKVVVPEKETKASLDIENTDIGESDLDFGDTDSIDIGFPVDAVDDDDILSQIDKVADLGALNLMDEDIVQPI